MSSLKSSSESLIVWCAIGLTEVALPAWSAEPAPQATKSNTTTRFDSEQAKVLNPASEVEYVLRGLDHEEYRERLKAQEYVDTHAERLMSALIKATSLGRASFEVRFQLLRIAEARSIPVDRPERRSFNGVEWAIMNIGTPSGAERQAVSEILDGNPLIYAKPEYLAALGEELEGRTFVASVEDLAVRHPLKFVFALEALHQAELITLFQSQAGKAIVHKGVTNAIRCYLANSSQLGEALQVKLLGESQRNINALVEARLESSTDIKGLVDLVARAGRVNNCVQRLSALGINYSTDGLPLLEVSAEAEPARLKIMEQILVGVARHYDVAAAAVLPNVPDQCKMATVAAKFAGAGDLWRIALNESEYQSWLKPAGIDTSTLLGDAILRPSAVADEDFLRRCWESSIIVRLSPDGKRPGQWALSIIPAVKANLCLEPPRQYDTWKLEGLDDWIEIAGGFHKLSLPKDLYPSALIQASLPPNHVGGQGSPFGSLSEYSALIREAYAKGTVCPQSRDVIQFALQKLSLPYSTWQSKNTQEVLDLIHSIEDASHSLERDGRTPAEIETHLNELRDHGIEQILAPKPEPIAEAPVLPAQNPDEHPTVQSLKRVMEQMERALKGAE